MKFSKKAVIIPVILLVAGVYFFYSITNRTPFSEKKPAVGEMAPEIFLADLSGKMIRLSELRGKVILLNFWASWCPPCKAELTEFQKVYEKFENNGFEIIAISINDISPSLIIDMKLSFPVANTNSRVTHDYGDISNVPVSFLIDKEGRIIKKLKEVYATDSLINDIENALKSDAAKSKS
jgi:peroxiredoxin